TRKARCPLRVRAAYIRMMKGAHSQVSAFFFDSISAVPGVVRGGSMHIRRSAMAAMMVLASWAAASLAQAQTPPPNGGEVFKRVCAACHMDQAATPSVALGPTGPPDPS